MKGIVVYESMFGSTRAVAESVAEGMAEEGASVGRPPVLRAADVGADDLEGVDFVVVGAPTHAHGLPRASTRRGAPDTAAKTGGELILESGASAAPGVREWLSELGNLPQQAAAFDTRVRAPAIVTGRASKTIARELRRHGAELVADPESFLVAENRLAPGELERARSWGRDLAFRLQPSASPHAAT